MSKSKIIKELANGAISIHNDHSVFIGNDNKIKDSTISSIIIE